MLRIKSDYLNLEKTEIFSGNLLHKLSIEKQQKETGGPDAFVFEGSGNDHIFREAINSASFRILSLIFVSALCTSVSLSLSLSRTHTHIVSKGEPELRIVKRIPPFVIGFGSATAPLVVPD